MPPIVDELMGQTGPGTAANTQGFGAPAHLALMQEQTQQARDRLNMDKQNHQIQAWDKFLEIGAKTAKAKGPYQKMLFDQQNKVGQMIGMPPMDQSMLSAIQGNSDKYFQVASQLRSNRANWTSENLNSFRTLHGDPTSADNELDKIATDLTKRENGKLTALSSTTNTQARADATKYVGQLNAAGKGVTTTDEFGNSSPTAVNTSAGTIAAQKQQVADATTAGVPIKQQTADAATLNASANAGLKNQQAKVVQQGADAKTLTAQAAMKRAQLTGNSTQSHLQIQQERLNATQLATIQRDLKPIQQTSFQADKATALLNKPDLTWGEAKEALTDYSKALSGASTNAIAREQGMSDGYFTLGDKVRQLYGKYVANNPEDAKINANTLNLIKNDVKNLSDTVKAQYKSVVQTNLELRRGTSLHPNVIDQAYKVYGAQPPAAGQASANLSPGSAAGAATSTAKPAFSAAQVQTMVQKGGADYTRQYLKGKGYSDSEIVGLGVGK